MGSMFQLSDFRGRSPALRPTSSCGCGRSDVRRTQKAKTIQEQTIAGVTGKEGEKRRGGVEQDTEGKA